MDMDDFIVPDDEDDEDAPVKKPKKQATPVQTPKAASASTSRFAFKRNNGNSTSVKTPVKPASEPTPKGGAKSFGKGKHEIRHDWLINVRDADKNPPDHPDYDPRTLYIPSTAWKDFSPFEKQYWEIKCKNFDTVVFFRKGKFYELFENDAST